LPNPRRLRLLYLSYLSKPASDRPIYRALQRQKAQKVLELGIGIGQRAIRMIEVASRFHPIREIQFVGMDLFEARSSADGPGVTLKMAYRLLNATRARVQLVPGDPLTGLMRVANALGQVDLMVISSRLDPGQLRKAWLYVPRLLHERSQVFLERTLAGGRTSVRLLERSEIEQLAVAAVDRKAA
jgi:hypothetical protein